MSSRARPRWPSRSPGCSRGATCATNVGYGLIRNRLPRAEVAGTRHQRTGRRRPHRPRRRVAADAVRRSGATGLAGPRAGRRTRAAAARRAVRRPGCVDPAGDARPAARPVAHPRIRRPAGHPRCRRGRRARRPGAGARGRPGGAHAGDRRPASSAGRIDRRTPSAAGSSCSTGSASGSRLQNRTDEGNFHARSSAIVRRPRRGTVAAAGAARRLRVQGERSGRVGSPGDRGAVRPGRTHPAGRRPEGRHRIAVARRRATERPALPGAVLHVHLRSAADRGRHRRQDRLRDHRQHPADLRCGGRRQGQGGFGVQRRRGRRPDPGALRFADHLDRRPAWQVASRSARAARPTGISWASSRRPG